MFPHPHSPGLAAWWKQQWQERNESETKEEASLTPYPPATRSPPGKQWTAPPEEACRREGCLSAGLLPSPRRGLYLSRTKHLPHSPALEAGAETGRRNSKQSPQPAGQALSSELSAVSTAHHPLGEQMHTQDAQFTTEWSGWWMNRRCVSGKVTGRSGSNVVSRVNQPQGGIPTLPESKFLSSKHRCTMHLGESVFHLRSRQVCVGSRQPLRSNVSCSCIREKRGGI